MIRYLLPFLFTSALVLAADSATIPASDARKHIGEVVTVSGHVDGLKTLSSGMELINLDGRYPNQALTVVVPPAAAAAVGDTSRFAGKTITVHGKVTEYKGAPQIEVTSADAIHEAESGAKS